MTLLRGGDALFPAMAEALASARRSVWLATYLFHDDAAARAPVLADAFANDEIGAVWHVYREIAQRIPRKAYTRHASTLGEASR